LKYIPGTETEHPDYNKLVRRLELRLAVLREADPDFSTDSVMIDDVVFVDDCDPEVVFDVAGMYSFRRELCPFGDFYSTHPDIELVRANGVWLRRPADTKPSDLEHIAKCPDCRNTYDQTVKGVLAQYNTTPLLN
jgi:hypothetical protein